MPSVYLPSGAWYPVILSVLQIRLQSICRPVPGILYYYTPVGEQTTNTESVLAVQYFVRSLPALTWRKRRHRYPVHSPELEVDKRHRKSSARTVLLAYFRVFWPYFRVNSVDKSCRKAIINSLRESNTKIDENKRKSAVVEYFW